MSSIEVSNLILKLPFNIIITVVHYKHTPPPTSQQEAEGFPKTSLLAGLGWVSTRPFPYPPLTSPLFSKCGTMCRRNFSFSFLSLSTFDSQTSLITETQFNIPISFLCFHVPHTGALPIRDRKCFGQTSIPLPRLSPFSVSTSIKTILTIIFGVAGWQGPHFFKN